MKVVFFDQVIADCNLVEVVKGFAKGNSATRNHLFLADNQKIVVETTASKLMDAVALLPVELQAQLMAYVATLVPNLGDSVSLVKREGGSTNLSAVITRLKPTGDEMRLLITR
jgi:hypothetical protein